MTEKEYEQHVEIFKKATEYLSKIGSFYFDEDCKNELTDAYEAGYKQAIEDLKKE